MNLLTKEKVKNKKSRRTLKQKISDDVEISVKNYESKDKFDHNLSNAKFIFLGFVFLIIIILLSFLFIF